MSKLEADIRDAQRHRDGYTRHPGSPYAQTQPPADGDYRARLGDRIEHLTELTYWRQIREKQITDGLATNYGPATVRKG